MKRSLDLSHCGIDLYSDDKITVELSIDEGEICERAWNDKTPIEIKVGNRKRMAYLIKLDIPGGYLGTFVFYGRTTAI